jgi:hypothetical protein
MVRSLVCGALFAAAVLLHLRRHSVGFGVRMSTREGVRVVPAIEEALGDLLVTRGVTTKW